MGENLTARQKAKIAYLRRLCLTWKRFTEVNWKDVLIIIDEGEVHIVWYQLIWLKDPDGTKHKHFNQSFKHFPIAHIGKQIKEYKLKIRNEFKNRHKPKEQ
jgi:hypothetical protein